MTNIETPRDRIAYLIYHFDASHDGDRTRADYLACADDILHVLAATDDAEQLRRTLTA